MTKKQLRQEAKILVHMTTRDLEELEKLLPDASPEVIELIRSMEHRLIVAQELLM